MKWAVILMVSAFVLLGAGPTNAAPCVGKNNVPCPTVTVMVPSPTPEDPGHLGRLIDIAPTDPNEKATATTYAVFGILGAAIAMGLMAYLIKKSREKGADEARVELLTVIRETNGEDTQPLRKVPVSLRGPGGKHRA